MSRLKKRGIATAGCDSGENALELIKEQSFDVVILDIKMSGGMDGIETLREIKKIRPKTDVLLLTDHGSVETSVEAVKEGAFDYLHKPIKLEALLEKVARALEKKDTEQHRRQSEHIRKSLKFWFNVLIVDDEKDFLDMLMTRLRKRGIKTAGCSSGEKALELIKEKIFDVVILDIKMPGGMDGIETLREIKKLRPDTEVLLLTGHGSEETRVEGMREGAIDYLLKPIKLGELLEKVAEALEKQGTQEHRRQSEQIRKLIKYW
jgi:DNA-binding NtrC family response regulator